MEMGVSTAVWSVGFGVNKTVHINHAPSHRLHTIRESYWLSTNFCSFEIVYSRCVWSVTVMAAKKWHFVVYRAFFWHFGRPLLRELDASVWWLAFCEFYLTCRIIVYYIWNKGFSFDIISVSHFWLQYTGLVCGLLYGQCGPCMVYTDPNTMLFKRMSMYYVWRFLYRFMFVFACIQVCLLTSSEHWPAVAAMVSMLPTTTSDGLLASHLLK